MERLVGTVFLLAPVAAVLVAVVVVIRLASSRVFSGAVKPWAEAAVYCSLATVVMYVWGAWHLFTWDVEEVCRLVHGEALAPGYGQETFFPLGKKCNEHFDLVPAYVNPAMVVLLTATVFCVAVARYRHRRGSSPS